MKKLILITMASTAAVFGAFAQGSLSQIQAVFNNDGITFGIGNQDPASTPDSAYYTGNVDLEILYSATATTGDINTLNSLDGTYLGGYFVLELAENSYGFSVVSATTVTGNTAGILGGNASYVADGDLSDSSPPGGDHEVPNEVGLLSPVPTGGSGALALFGVATDGPEYEWSGLIAWTQGNMGGNPNGIPPGIPRDIVQDPSDDNLDLTIDPEPTTFAIAALGGLSLLLFRRRR